MFTQAIRAGKAKKQKDIHDEWEIEGIFDEKTKLERKGEYKIKWVGYTRTNWEKRAQEILNDWKRKKKTAKSANPKLKVKLPTRKLKRSE